MPAAAHDQEVRVLRGGDESGSGAALNYHLAHLKAGVGSQGTLDDLSQHLLGLFFWIPARRPNRFSAPIGGPRPRCDRLQGGVGELGLCRRPLQCVEGLKAVNTYDDDAGFLNICVHPSSMNLGESQGDLLGAVTLLRGKSRVQPFVGASHPR